MKSIWVVGASSGIGESLALAYAKLGYRVFISARSESRLNALALAYNGTRDELQGQGSLIPLVMDVTSESSILEATSQLKNVSDHLSKVIINAGTCEYIDDIQVDIDLVRRVMETNLFGAIEVSNHAMPLLQGASNGPTPSQLVFVSSSVTFQALPRAHAYGGSKAALRYFAECLKMDVQKQGVDVRIVSPGFVKTPLTDKNDFDMPFMISSEDAAQRIIKGLGSSRFDIHFPKRFTLLLKMFSWLPNVIKFKILGKASRVEPEQKSNFSQEKVQP